jgi:hypothetical protein
MWWSVFFAAPGGDSLTARRAPGALAARIHAFGSCAAFLGCRLLAHRLFVVQIGDALAVVSLRDDMPDMFGFCALEMM